jgi:hypothetical protein
MSQVPAPLPGEPRNVALPPGAAGVAPASSARSAATSAEADAVGCHVATLIGVADAVGAERR